jgi:hypothetical protein
MALTISDRIKETSSTTGTGTYTLAGAVIGFETFTANLSNSDTTYYCCTDNTDFEVGLGTFTTSGTTLARTTILASSNSNNAVSWGAGTRTVFCTLPAAKTIVLDASGNASVGGTITATGVTLGEAEAILLGDSADLQISHTGSYSLISDSGTGNLILACQDFQLTNPSVGENMITATVDGAVTLYHDNGAKLATTSTGIDVTGTVTATGTSVFTDLDISGDVDVDGTLETDALTIAGVTLAETIADTVGAMVTSNTESGITVAYDDADNTLDFTVGTLNQNTTGSAATLTTPRAIGGVNFDGSADINLPGVNAAGNQNTSGTAAVATAITVSDNESTNENNVILFGAGAAGSGTVGVEADGNMTYNPSTGKITATGFIGALTGDVTGNLTGTVATATQNSITTATGLTSTGALNAGSITSGFGAIDNGASTITTTGAVGTGALTAGGNIIIPNAGNIGSVGDTDSIAIASNGVVTFSQIPVLPANSINSDAYVDGSIDTEHIADANVTLAKIANQAANTVLVRDANSSGVVSAKAVATTQILIGNGTGFTVAALSGDVTMTNAGVVTIAATSVEGSMLNTNVISGQTELASGLALTDELLVSDAGVLKRMDVSVLTAVTDDNATALAIALG